MKTQERLKFVRNIESQRTKLINYYLNKVWLVVNKEVAS